MNWREFVGLIGIASGIPMANGHPDGEGRRKATARCNW